jgi:hypothetical protein
MAAQWGMNRMPKIGTRVRVEWINIVGVVNDALSKAVPQACWTEGVLVRVEPLFIVLASSQYIDDGNDPAGDYTAIVRGCVTSIKRRK